MEITNLWERLLPRLQQQQRDGLELNTVAEFCGAALPTVHDWVAGKHPAQGERLIRLWHLLHAAGSDSPELERLDPYNRFLSELFGYSVITLSEATQLFGQKHPQQALKALRGQPVMHPAHTLDEVHILYDESVQKAREALAEKLHPSTGAAKKAALPAREPAAAPSNPLKGIVLTDSTDTESVALRFAVLLSSALPLAKHFVSDKCTPEERSYLRELLGLDNMFELSNLLNSLCSERARTQGR